MNADRPAERLRAGDFTAGDRFVDGLAVDAHDHCELVDRKEGGEPAQGVTVLLKGAHEATSLFILLRSAYAAAAIGFAASRSGSPLGSRRRCAAASMWKSQRTWTSAAVS